jgi:PiT family inorganic phosphate transporter
MAVGFGAAFTVLLATRFGFPISTTHSLVGGLLGAGLMAVGGDVNFSRLGGAFFIPLLVSPFIALILGGAAYWFFTRTRQALNISKESCICIGERREYVPVTSLTNNHTGNVATTMNRAILPTTSLDIVMAENNECMDIYTDRVWGLSMQKVLDIGHGVSAATVSFARGLNDTPKIAGLLVAVQAFDVQWGMVAIAVGMAIGGLLNARRVAETISNKITELNHGQGFSANLVTGLLVIFASNLGVPVSTTHVSVGSIFGIGMVTGKRHNRVIVSILLSWLITLPVAVMFSSLTYWVLA